MKIYSRDGSSHSTKTVNLVGRVSSRGSVGRSRSATLAAAVRSLKEGTLTSSSSGQFCSCRKVGVGEGLLSDNWQGSHPSNATWLDVIAETDSGEVDDGRDNPFWDVAREFSYPGSNILVHIRGWGCLGNFCAIVSHHKVTVLSLWVKSRPFLADFTKELVLLVMRALKASVLSF